MEKILHGVRNTNEHYALIDHLFIRFEEGAKNNAGYITDFQKHEFTARENAGSIEEIEAQIGKQARPVKSKK